MIGVAQEAREEIAEGGVGKEIRAGEVGERAHAEGAIVAGRVFSMPHASKVGVISIVVVFLAAIGYMILPSMITGITGSGCV